MTRRIPVRRYIAPPSHVRGFVIKRRGRVVASAKRYRLAVLMARIASVDAALAVKIEQVRA